MSAPRRCFLSAIPTLDPAIHTIRIMGLLVSMDPLDDNDNDHDNGGEYRYQYQLVLDDGTGTISIQTPSSMTDRIQAHVGMTLECIARRLRPQPKQQQDCWHADTLIVVTDSAAESVRWMELSHRPPPQPAPHDNTNNNHWKWGYPCVPIDEQEVYRMICTQAQLPDDPGVTAEELAIVLQRPLAEMQGFVQELQLTGQVYQNENGCYVPL